MPSDSTTIADSLLAKLQELPEDQQRQVLEFASTLAMKETTATPRRNLRGLWKDLGISISAEEIDAARREMWGNFPRDEFYK